ncbi:hypothetical protein P6B95_33135 [Streptomyces atratus]|uniref:hypothetical protein n=1 Tax=Streptomyces atratus TaxID=1893 RepID=UPI0019A60B5F|nr:hypothetical protein [Streptomyces atratus]WPW31758.1 hypothetical protein P6B95_33135 [Streptomyces atratus]GGT71455.1 hypothetical protein GCM10010207_81970 [Streptomyces atratus]
MTSPSSGGDRVPVEPAEMRGKIRTASPSRTAGSALRFGGRRRPESDIGALQDRVAVLERDRRPLPAVAAVTGAAGVATGLDVLAPATGNCIEAVGTALKSGRTPTVCQLEVHGVQDDRRKLVANGQQTLIRVNRPER